MSSEEDAKEDFEKTWSEFKENLFDIRSDFDPFHWIIRLIIAWLRRFQLLYHFKGHIVQFFPLAVIGIILFVLWVYYSSLHSLIMIQNFPTCSSDKNSTARFCMIHDTLLKILPLYLGTMIIFNFLCTVFSSPGTCDVPHSRNLWKTTQGQGGMCYLNPTTVTIRGLESWFQQDERIDDVHSSKHSIADEKNPQFILLPSPYNSFCTKCKIQRPPRCHHCSKCNRCILQMDHHCYFVNNCIGYNNYRTFMLTIIYLVIGCWYGLLVCALPLYNIMNDSNFKDIVYDWNYFRQSIASMEQNELLKIVVFILLFAGMFLTVFLYSHLRYISMGVTTIERMQMINLHVDLTVNKNDRTIIHKTGVKNCFDQGIYRNFVQVFGEYPIRMALLPIRVDPPAPYLPQIPSIKKQM